MRTLASPFRRGGLSNCLGCQGADVIVRHILWSMGVLYAVVQPCRTGYLCSIIDSHHDLTQAQISRASANTRGVNLGCGQ
ncbi:protein of unknown function [Candidatus Methylomirabilis oxygeniifera]|uniref:Uncharacterized protein n=1 Tax=Methylomirabilis oxygeniifera TaxID=671143 RepID=D5MMX6_METO1|nr:protein of unknown function [Candidatus Methylomirabilis oxyfera]